MFDSFNGMIWCFEGKITNEWKTAFACKEFVLWHCWWLCCSCLQSFKCWSNITYFLFVLRYMSNSACILQDRACLLWSGGHWVTTRWPWAASPVSLSSASVKNQVFLLDSWNQVFRITASLVWWNWALVLTEMKMSSWLRSQILDFTGLGSVACIRVTSNDCSWGGWPPRVWLCCWWFNGTRVNMQIRRIESTRTAQLICTHLCRLEPRIWAGNKLSLSLVSSLLTEIFSITGDSWHCWWWWALVTCLHSDSVWW